MAEYTNKADQDLGDQLNDWLKEISKRIPKTESSAKITAAGAAVLAADLKSKAEKHRTNRKYKKYGHLADNIVLEATDIDGSINGKSVVGFSERAYIARFLNDGTEKMSATHFVDNARKESETAVFEAEKAEYERLVGGK